jgi:hypothetical protein
MKRMILLAGLFLLMLTGISNKSVAQVSVSITYQDFYDGLSPYGRWMNYPEYGYVWRPNNISGFRPYSTGGHWVWTEDYGWMWASDYDWGWATFHYGRWFYDSFYGWMWVPGYEWSPAWVMWRGGGDYYGWAPIGPGINFNINIGFGSYYPPDDYWCFVPRRYVYSRHMSRHCFGYDRNRTIINNTTIINNYYYRRNTYITGPDRHEVEQYTNERIRPVKINELNRPGRSYEGRNQVNIYRPVVQKEEAMYVPKQYDDFDKKNRPNADNNGNGRPNHNNPFERGNPQPDKNAPVMNDKPSKVNRPNFDNNKEEMPVMQDKPFGNKNGNGRPNHNNPFERGNPQPDKNEPVMNDKPSKGNRPNFDNNKEEMPVMQDRPFRNNNYDNGRSDNNNPYERKPKPQGWNNEQPRQNRPEMMPQQEPRPSAPRGNTIYERGSSNSGNKEQMNNGGGRAFGRGKKF